MSDLLPIELDAASRSPIYDQIESQLRTLIVSGQLPDGTVLPSIRKLATSLSCSVITTRRAYQNLEQQGYIKTIQGKGTFVDKIDSVDQDARKQEEIWKAMKKAANIGRRYQYSKRELRTWFEKALEEADKDD